MPFEYTPVKFLSVQRLVIGGALIAGCSGLASAALAQDCRSYEGQRVQAVSFDQAAATLGQTRVSRDEFETSASYEARLGAATRDIPPTMFIEVPLNREHIRYDADRGAFIVLSYALRNRNTYWDNVFYNSNIIPRSEYDNIHNIDIVVSSDDAVTGQYQAQNAYGASWPVDQITRSVRAIFERRLGSVQSMNQDIFGPRTSGSPPREWVVTYPAESARNARDGFRAVTLIVPRSPYYFENSAPRTARITVQNPRDITQESQVIFADIRCLFMTDADGTVLLAVPTQ